MAEQPKPSGWKTAGNALSILGATMRDTSHALRSEQSNYLQQYMDRVKKMEEARFEANAFQKIGKIYDERGGEGVLEAIQDNPKLLEPAVKYSKLASMFEANEKTMINPALDMYRERSPDAIGKALGTRKKGGFLGFGAETVPDVDELTMRTIQTIESVEDVEELMKNREAFEQQGVDVDAVIKYFRRY